jgi:hypothetical protein
MTIAVRVPPGTTATVVVRGAETGIGPGRHEFTMRSVQLKDLDATNCVI